MLKKIVGFALVCILIISSVCIFSGCGKKEEQKEEISKEVYEVPIRNYMEGIKNKDISLILSAYPSFMQTITQADLDAIYAKYEAMYGANIVMEYTLSDGVKIEEQKDLDTLASQIKEYYPDAGDIHITAAYIITVELTVSGDGVKQEEQNAEENKNKDTQDFYVYRLNDNWYVF